MTENYTPAADREDAVESLRLWAEKYSADNGHSPLAFVHSYGCQQNVSDGEKIKGMLAKVGYDFTDDTDSAQLILLNTCAVRENAEDRVFGNIGNFKKLKEQNRELVIGICGCMAQQKHVAEKIKASYRQVDLVFGTFAYNDMYSMLWEVISKHKRLFNQSEACTEIDESMTQLREDKVRAFLPIMYGCNNFCTYCIVPYVRGRERSRKPEAVIAEVRSLVEQGYKEITLLGQNVNSYEYGFPALLREIDKIEGKYRIRFMSSHPKDATKELIDAIIDCEHVCTHLHLPVQAGSNRVLKAMNRRYTVEKYMEMIDYARSRVPDFSFTTDLIVGFPGETYEEFCETKEVIKRVKYDNIYSFVYSRRSGTPAAKFEDHVTDKQKGLWLRELLLEQREITSEWFGRFVGRTVEVLVEGEGRTGEGWLTGKNDENIIVEVKADKKYIGEFVRVRITKAMNWALSGELVSE
ncbi:tRNA (N6-isopentenyl adenosine(37)-C2)-methylthiotransferase MiaB [Ruminococcus albus]|uniref:tRNA-2-methylthio-N(6)-dimethylallyladenosine synthase n=1 Tax=Ruminococcus albus 8 TaxID=246199 RepID=E9SEM1_RUMAL|nr:tRNA (N6-isopentenyl adenosine(37)-C2)-methylthiotransferase MiaB [Ruminococcus albus]EGC02248.1 tRNA-i(6)A37 thiotransferase enzyme MiaB [Ruminococcus albus 8]MCC3351719.1 tRNA (N6-isopentenyl adenosine(37)-C2)-methylthiotransferase MiaB [Ruminococcus albus 8]